MKHKINIYTLFFLILSGTIFSCSDDDDNNNIKRPVIEENKHNSVNEWIYNEMSKLYLWNDFIPEHGKLNFNTDPYDFFENLLYKYNTSNGDRFSHMDGTHASLPKMALTKSSSNNNLGFDYCLINFSNNEGVYQNSAALVFYVEKSSDAYRKGLRRGCLISEVDGETITKSNWYNVLNNNKTSYEIKFAKNNDLFQKKNLTQKVISTDNPEHSPILLDSTYTVNGHKIGYLVYTSFNMGSLSNREYDVEMANTLTKFKNEGINELVLDLRYNGGGYVQCAKYLASSLVPNRDTKNIFEIKTYNKTIQAELNNLPDNDPEKIKNMYSYFADYVQNDNNKNLASIPRLGDQLNNIYVIGTRFTASASEMTVNTLRPYLEENGKHLYLVGETTVGKNVGSWPIYEDDNKNNPYVLWPIIFRSHNKTYNKSNPELSSAYSKGFNPDIPGDDLDLLYEGLKDFGDQDETLLKIAINQIQGINTPKSFSKSKQKVTLGKSSTEIKNGGFIMIDEPHTTSMTLNKN